MSHSQWEFAIEEIGTWEALENHLIEFDKPQHGGDQTPLFSRTREYDLAAPTHSGRLVERHSVETRIRIEAAALSQFRRQAHLHLSPRFSPRKTMMSSARCLGGGVSCDITTHRRACSIGQFRPMSQSILPANLARFQTKKV